MNKLASIDFLQALGLPTIFPEVIRDTSEKKVRARVKSFYYNHEPGWVLRCAEPPESDRPVERGLPWDMAQGKDELIEKVLAMQREVGSGYLVFCHPAKEMIRGGVMLIEGNRVVVDSATGGPRELSAFYRGYRSPEQTIVFNPGMLSQQRYGREVLHRSDLLDIRTIERTLNWGELDAISDPVCVEFSFLKGGELYVHDLSTVK